MESMTPQEFHQQRFHEFAHPKTHSVDGAGPADWTVDGDSFLQDLTERTSEVQQQTFVALDTIRRSISPNIQDFSSIDLTWVQRRVRSCTLQQLDLLYRVLQYEGGRGTVGVPDGPSPVSRSSCDQNMAEMYSLFELSVPEKIEPINITNLDACWVGLYAALHLTEEWLVYSKAPQSSNMVAYVGIGGALWGTTRAWIHKDIREPMEWLNSLGIDVYADVRLPCSQDVQPPLKDPALYYVNTKMRAIRNRHPNTKLLVWAWSAGGYLAACSDTPAEICILIYPVLSMMDGYTDEGTQRRALGRTATDDEKYMASAHMCTEKMQQTELHIQQSIEDKQAPIKATLQYVEAFHKQGGSVAVNFNLGGPHGGPVDYESVKEFIGAAGSEKRVQQNIDLNEIRRKIKAGEPVKVCNYYA